MSKRRLSPHSLNRTAAPSGAATSSHISASWSARCALAFCAASSFLITHSAHAQSLENEVSVQRFDVAPGAGNFITTRSAAVTGHLDWTTGVVANYGYRPFEVNLSGYPAPIRPVENMVTADVMGTFSIFERVQFGLKIPISWVKGHGIMEDEDGLPSFLAPKDGGLDAVGLGDIQLEIKGRFYGEEGELFRIGGYAYGTIPTGHLTAENSYIGNSSASFAGYLIADGDLGPFAYGVNLGGMYRKQATIGNVTIGSEMRFSAAASYEITPIVGITADLFGATDFSSSEKASSAVELDGAVKIFPLGRQLSFMLGGGGALYRGVGSPTVRGFFGIGYDARVQDRDGDGISDATDACPDAAEDMDGFEDGDGCPELDNDGDGLPDDADKCIDEPEDFDDFQDDDGCPDLDNDGDSLDDFNDECPNEPETVNGVDDLDGCPDDADTDKDGVPDGSDKCPNEPEDTDGFQDTDGCPDADNDGDGVPDESDECIDEAEDGQGEGRETQDGCPYEG